MYIKLYLGFRFWQWETFSTTKSDRLMNLGVLENNMPSYVSCKEWLAVFYGTSGCNMC